MKFTKEDFNFENIHATRANLDEHHNVVCAEIANAKLEQWINILPRKCEKMMHLLSSAKRLIGLYVGDASDGRAMECANWLQELEEMK